MGEKCCRMTCIRSGRSQRQLIPRRRLTIRCRGIRAQTGKLLAKYYSWKHSQFEYELLVYSPSWDPFQALVGDVLITVGFEDCKSSHRKSSNTARAISNSRFRNK